MDRPIPTMSMVANKEDLIKLLQAEITEAEVTRKELERQLTIEINVQRAQHDEAEKWELVAKKLESENAALKAKFVEADDHLKGMACDSWDYNFKIIALEKENAALKLRNCELEINLSGKILVKTLYEEIDGLKAEIKEYKEQGSEPYCPNCGICGEDGCCSTERCKYPDIKSALVKEVKDNYEELWKVNVALEERLASYERERGEF